jgi:PKD domain-containing protein
MPLRKLLPIALLLAAVSIRCTGNPGEPAPVGQVAVTVTTTTTTTSTIPDVTPGTITFFPSGTALAAATLVSFQSQTPPSGGVPPYAFAWTFGDGDAGSGATPGHLYASPGNFLVRLTVSDSRGMSAQTSAPITVRTVSGRWSATFTGGDPPVQGQRIDLVQNAGAVAATINDAANLAGLGSGTGGVTNPRAMTLSVTFPAALSAPFAATYIGNLDATLTTWTGTVNGFPGCPCTFTATRPSADPLR